jgi:hypothetical protein
VPRHPKPIPILHIQGLSDGMPQDIEPPQVDDFTGLPIPRVWPDVKPKAMASAQDLQDEANREKHRINQLLLQAAGIIPKCEPAHSTPTKRQFTKLILIRKPQDWRRI